MICEEAVVNGNEEIRAEGSDDGALGAAASRDCWKANSGHGRTRSLREHEETSNARQLTRTSNALKPLPLGFSN